tara:strand:+ start:534 stop:917 length:384 start_codon:yes stop_codon:yes gene_type:complete
VLVHQFLAPAKSAIDLVPVRDPYFTTPPTQINPTAFQGRGEIDNSVFEAAAGQAQSLTEQISFNDLLDRLARLLQLTPLAEELLMIRVSRLFDGISPHCIEHLQSLVMLSPGGTMTIQTLKNLFEGR